MTNRDAVICLFWTAVLVSPLLCLGSGIPGCRYRRSDDARQDLSTIAAGIRVFKNKFPQRALTEGSLVATQILEKLTDPWDRPYQLIDHGTWYGVMTFGRDGVFGGEEDDTDHVIHITLNESGRLVATKSW